MYYHSNDAPKKWYKCIIIKGFPKILLSKCPSPYNRRCMKPLLVGGKEVTEAGNTDKFSDARTKIGTLV